LRNLVDFSAASYSVVMFPDLKKLVTFVMLPL